jgi:UDP-N-acetylglucosamine--N-acetylmuramyl-(pentapeptide) pyrophosphoryl-undecaprenol N-acetylglucosamine transferase
MKILFVGGGTGGPVVPLLAVAEKLKAENPKAEFLFVGTRKGPERLILKKAGFAFKTVSAGKLRRYFSLRTVLVPFQLFLGFLQSLRIVAKFKPDVVFGVGGYVSVPVMYAAFLMGRKIMIHQQDVEPTLTNKLVAPIATKITISFEHSAKDFFTDSGLFRNKESYHKIVWTGNPFREELLKAKTKTSELKKKLHLSEELPVLLVLGGATGALKLNQILEEALPELVQAFQVIHSTGSKKGIGFKHKNYHPHELITDMAEVYQVSDVILSRAGLSTITELSALKKVSIIVPMPDSHQLFNAEILEDKNAAIVVQQEYLTAAELNTMLRVLIHDGDRQKELSENIGKIMPHDATNRLAGLIADLAKGKKR